MLGRSAELAFEQIYRSETHPHEFGLRDLLESRTDTDYRLYNGQGRAIYRINIKFHGTQFRRAPELVSLDPLDCFALATYKTHSALQKQDQERLPYFFAIVGVSGLTAAGVGAAFPENLVEATALIHEAPRSRNKRDFEDRIVDYSVEQQFGVLRETYSLSSQPPGIFSPQERLIHFFVS